MAGVRTTPATSAPIPARSAAASSLGGVGRGGVDDHRRVGGLLVGEQRVGAGERSAVEHDPVEPRVQSRGQGGSPRPAERQDQRLAAVGGVATQDARDLSRRVDDHLAQAARVGAERRPAVVAIDQQRAPAGGAERVGERQSHGRSAVAARARDDRDNGRVGAVGEAFGQPVAQRADRRGVGRVGGHRRFGGGERGAAVAFAILVGPRSEGGDGEVDRE